MSFFTISGRLIKNYNQINFFTASRYNHKLKEILSNHGHAFCYKLYIPEIYITENFNDQQQRKILKITNMNEDKFCHFNYPERYIDNINYDCPYPLYYPCSRLLLNNFDGIDATNYTKKNNNENFCKEGLIWKARNGIKLELMDYITSLPSNM